MVEPRIAEIIDLDRYPLDQPASDGYRSLMTDEQAALRDRALFSLGGFVRPEMIAPMAREIEDLVPVAVRYDKPRITYFDADSALPPDHVHNQAHPCRYHQVLNYQIGNDSPLRRIFNWQPLAEFLRQLCGYQTFYRSECPHLALSAKIAGEGDTDGWHFDTNDVVFSLLLQAPEAGGSFEYAPHLRTREDERYHAVADVIADPGTHAIEAPLSIGDLTVFFGDLSFHRVTPVKGHRRRVVALFCYDHRPGTVFSASYIRTLQKGLPH